MTKQLLLTLCLCVLAAGAVAQDTLFLKDGGMFIGRIKARVKYGRTYYTVLIPGRADPLVSSSSVARVAYSSKPFRYRVRQPFTRRGDKELFTVIAPSYCYIGAFPGVSVGLEYVRFLDSSGKFSFNIGGHYFWAGTAAFGKVYRETRANIRGAFLEPGFSFHPFGNTHRLDPSIGISIPVGTMSRRNTTDAGKLYPVTTDDGSHLFLAFLLQGELCFHNYRHFVFSLYGSCGPMLPAGATSGLSGQVGFKIGGRF